MTEDMRSMLLEMLTNRDGLGNGINMQEVLSRMTGDSTKASLLAQFLTKSQAVEENDPEIEINEFEDEDDLVCDYDQQDSPRQPYIIPMQSAERSEISDKLRAKIAHLVAELDEMRARNDTLAAALGACYLCWGTDLACQVCQGKGRPGASIPDQKLFEQVIAPVVRKHYKPQVSSQNVRRATK